MRKLIVAATMTIPLLATGALAATTAETSLERETCTLESSSGDWGRCALDNHDLRRSRFRDLNIQDADLGDMRSDRLGDYRGGDHGGSRGVGGHR